MNTAAADTAAVPARKTPKQAFFAFCAEHGIEVDHTSPRYQVHHVHVQAPAGKMFEGYGVDNLGVWDGDDGAPDWGFCLRDVERAMPLVDDPDYEQGDA